MKKSFGVLLSFFCLLSFSPALQADPGMWPFHMLPKQLLRDRYGFEPSDEWIERLQFASVRVNSGGSGSFSSRYGLVATNHHVAVSALQQISTPEKDFLRDGFVARSLEEEIPIPHYTVSVLQSVDDITEDLRSVVSPDMTSYQAHLARERRIAEIEERISEETGETVEVVSLFYGRSVFMYRYKVYRDVRLVFAPENQAGFFGGDEANFHYPRHVLDEALFRVWETTTGPNGEKVSKPLEVEHFLPWSPYGSKEGDLLFISGHPGSTNRYLTSDELKYEREFRIPLIIDILESRRAALLEYSENGSEAARQAKTEIFSLENALKVYRAVAADLKSPGVIERREQEEKSQKARLGASDAHHYEAALEDIRKSLEVQRRLEKISLLSGRLGLNSELFAHANSIARYHQQMSLENLDRKSDYREANLDEFFHRLSAARPFYVDMEELKLFNSLQWMAAHLDLEHEISRKILGLNADEPVPSGQDLQDLLRARAKHLIRSSSLSDPEQRQAWIEEETPDFSSEPLLQLAAELLPLVDALEEQLVNEKGNLSRRAHRHLIALREDSGEVLAPDATFSLRLSFGPVSGYVDHGMRLPAYTQLGQAFEQARARAGEADWELPESWWQALREGRIDATTPMNFVSEHDTTGGNSGSPVVDIYGNKVGILFDGNKHGVGKDKNEAPRGLSRSVSVDCRVSLAAMGGIYNAPFLVFELTQGARPYTRIGLGG